MIFAASSFALTSNLIVQTTEAFIGADIKAQGNHFINEVPIKEFLDGQMTADGQPVVDYAFQTISTYSLVKYAGISND